MYFLPLHYKFFKISFNIFILSDSTFHIIRLRLSYSYFTRRFCMSRSLHLPFLIAVRILDELYKLQSVHYMVLFFILCSSKTLSLYRHTWSPLHGPRERASPRYVDVPCRLLIWRLFKPIFFELSRPRTWLAIFWRRVPELWIILEKFFRLEKPDFPIIIFPIIPVW